MARDVHSYLPHVLVRAQEALDVAEHLSDRHFFSHREVEQRKADNRKTVVNFSQTQVSARKGG